MEQLLDGVPARSAWFRRVLKGSPGVSMDHRVVAGESSCDCRIGFRGVQQGLRVVWVFEGFGWCLVGPPERIALAFFLGEVWIL